MLPLNDNDMGTDYEIALDSISEYVSTNTPSNSQYNIMDAASIREYMENTDIVAPEITGVFGVSYLTVSPRVMAILAERTICVMDHLDIEVPVDLENLYSISLDTAAHEMEGERLLIDETDADVIANMDMTPIQELVHIVSVFMNVSTVGMANEVAGFEAILDSIWMGDEEEDEEQPGMVE